MESEPKIPLVPVSSSAPTYGEAGQAADLRTVADIRVGQELDQQRAKAGKWVGAAGFAIILFVAVAATCALNKERAYVPASTIDLHYRLALVIAHAAVSVAMVWFGYQLLRLGERLSIPSWLLKKELVEVIRIVLGVKHPGDAINEATLRMVAKLLEKRESE